MFQSAHKIDLIKPQSYRMVGLVQGASPQGLTNPHDADDQAPSDTIQSCRVLIDGQERIRLAGRANGSGGGGGGVELNPQGPFESNQMLAFGCAFVLSQSNSR